MTMQGLSTSADRRAAAVVIFDRPSTVVGGRQVGANAERRAWRCDQNDGGEVEPVGREERRRCRGRGDRDGELDVGVGDLPDPPVGEVGAGEAQWG
jgi:hypothetical protein